MQLSRHGWDHDIPPPIQVNYRANIWALKHDGCTYVLASTAGVSLRAKIESGDQILPDQFIDFTRSRALSFFESFEPGNPVHPAMTELFDAGLRKTV